MLKLDKNTLNYFKERNAEKIKVFFYDAGCSGMKVNIVDEFEVDESVEEISPPSQPSPLQEEGVTQKGIAAIPSPNGGGLGWGFKVFIDKRDKDKLENCSITRVVIADHTGKEKVRYIYKWEEVKWRCGCGSSFNFGEEKKPKLDLGKLRDFKSNFKK